MNDRQQRAFDNLSQHVCGLLWSFDSSAKILQEKLSALGVASPVQLYYEYRFPDNQSAEQFEQTLQKIMFVDGFNPQQILNTSEYYQQELKKAMAHMEKSDNKSDKIVAGVKDYNDNLCKICEQDCSELTDAERKELADYIVGLRANVSHNIRMLASWLLQNNPELKSVRVDMTNDTMLLIFLSGVNYGYAPADIDYFINTNMNIKISDTDEIYTQLGLFDLYPNYIIRPDRAQKILDSVLIAHSVASRGKEL